MHNSTTLPDGAPDDPANSLLTPAETAALLGITAHTLAIWRTTGRYSLPYVKIGRCVRYRSSHVYAFIEGRTVFMDNEGR